MQRIGKILLAPGTLFVLGVVALAAFLWLGADVLDLGLAWSNFVWPNPQDKPGVHIFGTDVEGNTVEFLNEPGGYGLERMLESARSTNLGNGAFDLRWKAKTRQVVGVQLRIISNTRTARTTASEVGRMVNPPSVSGRLVGMSLPATVVGDGASQAVVLNGGKP